MDYTGADQSTQVEARRCVLLVLLALLVPALCWLTCKAVSLLRRNQWLIPAGGVVAYTLCSCGLVFSIIHSVPIAGYDDANMRYVLLASTSRAQYLLEGLFLSCCSTMASLAALGLIRAPHFADNSGSRSTNGRREGSSTCVGACETPSAAMRSSDKEVNWRQYFAALWFVALAAMMVFCSGFVMQCYRVKAPWYAPTFWPSPHLPKGALKVDWGNMF